MNNLPPVSNNGSEPVPQTEGLPSPIQNHVSAIAPSTAEKSRLRHSSSEGGKIKNLLPRRRRRSQIAALPKAARDQINQWLDDGLSYPAVRDKLAQQGIVVTSACVGRWRRGGYQDHLRELRLLDESRARFELTLDLTRQEQGIHVYEAAHKIAAGLIADAVAEIGADSLRQAITNNSLNLLRMLNSLTRLTAGGLKCERHSLDQADRDLRLHQPQSPQPKKGISKATIAEMEDALHLM